MNRYKKEIRKQGYKLENDYDWLPMDLGSVSIEGVWCGIINNHVVLCNCYTSIRTTITFDNCWNIIDIEHD